MSDQSINKEIEKFIQLSKNEKSVKQKKRYDVVLLHLEGHSGREISEVLHIPRRTVSEYLSLYEKGGVEALLLRKQPGRARFLTDAQEKELFQMISAYTPEEAGVGIFANWTAPLVCRLVEQRFHVKFSERGMRDLFYRIGLSYTRPTYTLNQADPKKQEAFRQQWEDLKKNFSVEQSTPYFLKMNP